MIWTLLATIAVMSVGVLALGFLVQQALQERPLDPH